MNQPTTRVIMCALALALALPAVAKDCTKGKRCGDTCIARDKACEHGSGSGISGGYSPPARPTTDGPMYLWLSAHSGTPYMTGYLPKIQDTQGRIEVWRNGQLEEVLMGEDALNEFMTREQRRREEAARKAIEEAEQALLRLELQRLEKYKNSIYNDSRKSIERLTVEAQIRYTRRRGQDEQGEAMSLRDEIGEILYAAHIAARGADKNRACELLKIGFKQTNRFQGDAVAGDEMERVVNARERYGCQ